MWPGTEIDQVLRQLTVIYGSKHLNHLTEGEDPSSGLETDSFDDPIGHDTTNNDTDGPANNGREEQVQLYVKVREVGIVVQLHVVTQSQRGWNTP